MARELRRLSGAVTCVAGVAFAGPAAAGEFLFGIYDSAQYVYDSNVYRFSRQVADVTGTTETADHFQRYAAGLETGYAWQRQELKATVEARRFQYQEFEHLDHNEYLVDAGFEGGLLGHTRGLLNYRDERRMASFEDRRHTGLILERDQAGTGTLIASVTPDWRIVTGARARILHSPLPDAPALPEPPPGAPARVASPDFTLHETAYHAGVQFGTDSREHPEAEAPLLAGVVLEHQRVDFSGVAEQPPPPPGMTAESFEGYRLLSLAGTVQYAVSGLSALDGKVGATLYEPQQASVRSRPALTGEVGYVHGVSEITELEVHLFRRIVPYAATADATTDTGASVGAYWEPLRGLTVRANYSWASSAFQNSGGIAPENSGRSDEVQNGTLSIGYPVMRFFAVRLFSAYSDRKSNREYNEYSDTIAGVEVSVRWPARE